MAAAPPAPPPPRFESRRYSLRRKKFHAMEVVMVFFPARNFARVLVQRSGAETGGWTAFFKRCMDIAANLLLDMAAGCPLAETLALWRNALLATRFKHRPRDSHPRAVKRRPKPYPYLTVPRSSCRGIFHRNHYRKTAI